MRQGNISLLREERLWRIAQKLTREHRVLANQLADEFGLGLPTIRLDLAELERRGLAKRVYGGAVLHAPEQPDYAVEASEARLTERLDVLQREKEAIGRAAAALLEGDETIMIDGGTTTFQVCRNLANRRNLTIISCALHSLWQELATRPNLDIFLTGGYLRGATLSLVGDVAETTLRGFRASKAILGIDGISLEHGLTTINFLEAGVKKRMIEASQQLIIVADHTKFGKVCLMPVAPVERATKIVTDAGVLPEFVEQLRERGVEVIIAT